MNLIQSFLMIAFFSLIINTYKDVKKAKIDSRYNYLCFGAYLIILLTSKITLLYFISLILITFLFTYLLRRGNFLGQGDLEALSWIIPSTILINAYNLITFFIFLSLFYILTIIIFKYYLNKNPITFYPAIFLSFVVANYNFFI
ncbi:MAG: hypothetical protein QW156_04375 [Candidatus Aenigmatarchaeota archaeon]